MADTKPIPSGLRAYLRQSRDLLTSLVLVVPLFVAYQIGVLTTGGVRNGVDFMTDALLLVTGRDLGLYLAVNASILLALLALIAGLRKRGSFHPRIFPFVLIESAFYALFFGSAVVAMARLLGLDVLLSVGSRTNALVLSIGAGLYEELVFRLFLMGGLFIVATRAFKVPGWLAALLAVVLSSLVFSAVHHVGTLGEAFTVAAFVFRFLAGVLLAAIFYLRGFAVAVYTHALYDVLVMVSRAP